LGEFQGLAGLALVEGGAGLGFAGVEVAHLLGAE
jgi:hypothetical protein